MKSYLFLPFALLLGLVIGGWMPNEELRNLRRENETLNEKLAAREKDSRMDAITRMMRIPDRAPATENRRRRRSPESGTDSTVQTAQPGGAGTNAPVVSASDTAAERSDEASSRSTRMDLKDRIEDAKDLWATRVQIARGQWISRLKLSPEAEGHFDATIDAMNAELQASIQGLADALDASGEITPELGVRLFNEMTASLVNTYNDLEAFVPAEQRGEASHIELTDFIDPAVAEPLIAVQDKLDNMPRPGRRFPRGRP